MPAPQPIGTVVQSQSRPPGGPPGRQPSCPPISGSTYRYRRPPRARLRNPPPHNAAVFDDRLRHKLDIEFAGTPIRSNRRNKRGTAFRRRLQDGEPRPAAVHRKRDKRRRKNLQIASAVSQQDARPGVGAKPARRNDSIPAHCRPWTTGNCEASRVAVPKRHGKGAKRDAVYQYRFPQLLAPALTVLSAGREKVRLAIVAPRCRGRAVHEKRLSRRRKKEQTTKRRRTASSEIRGCADRSRGSRRRLGSVRQVRLPAGCVCPNKFFSWQKRSAPRDSFRAERTKS